MRIPRQSARKARIEIIPMIDVIFFLLVFFMVATLSMAVYRGVPVNLPKAATGRDAVPESAALTLTRDGQIYLNKRAAGLDEVAPRLKGLLAENPNIVVIPNADENMFGVKNELETGFKAHFEEQRRKQVNGTSPTARSGTLVEHNLRETQAYSGFIANRFHLGPVTVMPVVRYEHIQSSRTDRLTGRKGSDSLGEWVPGLGLSFSPIEQVTLFAGIHRGFAPPRTEDIISGVGTSTDVGAEESINWEVGVRARPVEASLQAVFFRNDFNRLIAVGSIAAGSTPLAEGKALFQGVEFSGQLDLPFGPYLRTALTWLPTAEQVESFRQVVGGAVVPGSAPGNRQPYAPEVMFTGAIGYRLGGFDGQPEVVHVGSQFSNFANTPTAAPNGNGQVGEIDSYTILNLALNYFIRPLGTTAFVTVKNLTDQTYIVDRTRGIQVGMPLQVFGGLKYGW